MRSAHPRAAASDRATGAVELSRTGCIGPCPPANRRRVLISMADTITVLDRLATVPTDAEPFAEWLRGGDALEFLRWNASAEETVIFVSTDHTYVHGVFVPSSVIDEAKTVDLLAWDFNATGSWGISHSFSPASLSIVPPLDHPGSNAFHGGERLVFQRFFEGRIGTKSYFEILQRFTHVFDLHYVDERSAYCRLRSEEHTSEL